MEEAPVKEVKGKKIRPLRVLLWLLISILVLMITVLILIRVPAVQTRLTQYFAELLSDRTGFTTTVGGVSILWFDTIGLEEVSVEDSVQVELFSVDRLDLQFSRQTLLNPRNIVLGEAVFRRPIMQAVRKEGESKPNITRWVEKIQELGRKKDPNQPKPPFALSVEQIRLVDGIFGLRDYNRDSVPGFNYNHFYLTEVSATVPYFAFSNDTLNLEVEGLHARDSASGLLIHDSRAHYEFSKTRMRFTQMEMHVGESTLRDSIEFHYTSPRSFGYWVDSVDMRLWLHNSRVTSQDLAYFVPFVADYDDAYTFSGEFSGTVRRFDLRNFVVAFGRSSVLNGRVAMTGAPIWDETFITLDLSAMQIQSRDLKQYVPASAYPNVATVGRVRGKGQFFGFMNDFVANGTFRTALGNVKTDINLKLDGDENSKYEGALALEGFNLGKLTQQASLGMVDMQGQIDGRGFTANTANLHLNAQIDRFDLLDYSYQNISTDADLAAELFSGQISIEDKNLQFAMEGTIDISTEHPRVKASGLLDTLFLRELGWMDEESFLRTEFSIDAQGLALDSITGYGRFKDTYIEYQQRSHLIDSLTLYSSRFADQRSLQVFSDRLEVAASGPFDLSPVIADVQRLLYEYRLNFSNDADSIQAYYASRPEEASQPYHFDYSVSAIDINPFLNLFFPELYVGEKTDVEGTFRGGNTYILSMLSELDTLVFDGYAFGNSVVEVSTSKVHNESDVLASLILDSETQSLPGFSPSQNLFFESVWFNRTIDFHGGVKQQSSQSLAELEGKLEFESDRIRVSFLNSDFEVLADPWTLNEGAEIVVTQEKLFVKDLEFKQDAQRVALTGTVSDSIEETLNVVVENFNLENLNPLLPEPLQGRMNANASIADPFNTLLIEANVNIEQLYMSGFLVGNVEAESKFDKIARRLDLSGNLFRDDVRTVYIYGAYFPDDDQRLDMVANFNQANLSVAEPFFDATFSEIKGKASGTFRIRGTTDFPLLEGEGTVSGGHMRVNYLNTRYDFDGEIAFTENEIGFRNLEVRDENNSLAYLDGGIFHDGFKDFVFNLYGDFTNFQVMKTTAADNDYFYGTGVVTGSVEFLGSLSNLIISGDAQTQRGTRFYIPIDYSTTAEQAEFIRFVNLSDTTQQAEVGLEAESAVDLSDINLDFNLDVTTDAYVELIFDLKAGDIIRGRGAGELDLEIDSEGTFNMFGDLEIESGAYNFTLYNLINKEFEINPGSTLSWAGDPYEAQMDINATYTQLASLGPVVSGYGGVSPDLVSQSNELQRKYPAQALLYLDGDLLSPDIGFGVNVTDYPKTINASLGEQGNVVVDLEAALSAFKEALRTDEQELKRQVFSLIILKRFSDRQSFDIGPGVGTRALGSSVSELLSNQLSYWITQVDDNLEIDVDLNNLSPEALNTFQLRLSYSFLDGRLRVTRDGYILNEDANGDVGSDLATLIGDWSVEYLLTPDGKFRLKMYSRNNLNSGTNPTLASYFGTTTTTGVSFAHTQSFNNLGELFDWARKKESDDKPNGPVRDTTLSETPKDPDS